MQGSLIDQGLELMLYGMGTVVVFLTLLVLVTIAMSTLIQRFAPPPPPADKPPVSAGPDPSIVAAITAAIHQHRSGRDS